jgi:hypothetical protein
LLPVDSGTVSKEGIKPSLSKVGMPREVVVFHDDK